MTKTKLTDFTPNIVEPKLPINEVFGPTELENELWKGVPGYRDYQVSTLGRVRSLDKKYIDKLKRVRIFRGKILKLTPVKCGHLWVALCNRGKQDIASVHSLVLKTFVGPCPDGLEGCHHDDVGSNNRLCNLAWKTPKENAADRGRNNPQWRINSRKAARKVSAKLNFDVVKEMRELRATAALTYRQISDRYGVSIGTAHAAINGDSWKEEYETD